MRTVTNLDCVIGHYQLEKSTQPAVAVIDSQSIRPGLPHSEKGVDGGKKIKGIIACAVFMLRFV